MEPFIAMLAIVMIFGIPITAIISSSMIKMKKMNLQAQEGGISKEEKALLHKVLKENETLKQRIENLEMITSDADMLKLGSVNEDKLQRQIDTLKQELLKLNKENKTV